MVDPNPRVSGRGFDYLREHGISVTVGVGEAAARELNAPFVTWVTKRRPYVIAKSAVSADGFVGVPGARALLTGDEANRYFHRQRAEVDAIAVGAGTMLTDDPQLTVRHVRRERAFIARDRRLAGSGARQRAPVLDPLRGAGHNGCDTRGCCRKARGARST